MMQIFMKMSLTIDMYIGEDQLFSVSAKTTNKTIENVLRISRGLIVFNKMQENVQIKAISFLPQTDKIFSDIVNIYNEEDFGNIINLRHKKPGKMQTEPMSSKKDPIYVFDRQSKINNNLTEAMFKKETFFHKSFFHIKQCVFAIQILSAYFFNKFKLDFQQLFVIYYKEVHELYDSYTRKYYPIFIQTFNTFNIFYLGKYKLLFALKTIIL